MLFSISYISTLVLWENLNVHVWRALTLTGGPALFGPWQHDDIKDTVWHLEVYLIIHYFNCCYYYTHARLTHTDQSCARAQTRLFTFIYFSLIVIYLQARWNCSCTTAADKYTSKKISLNSFTCFRYLENAFFGFIPFAIWNVRYNI